MCNRGALELGAVRPTAVRPSLGKPPSPMALALHPAGELPPNCASILTVTNRRGEQLTSRSRLGGAAAAVLLVLSSGGARPSILQAQSSGVTAGAIRTYSTISSIGVEWDIAGDADHDSMATVEFRAAGTTAWRSALPLVRSTTTAPTCSRAAFSSSPRARAYEVRLTLADPDGGATVQTVAVATRPVPAMPAAGQDASTSSRARAVATDRWRIRSGASPPAEVVAQPGDIFLVHAGSYGGRITFTKPGTSSGYIVWKSAGDGEALFAGIDVSASYVWLEGLTRQRSAIRVDVEERADGRCHQPMFVLQQSLFDLSAARRQPLVHRRQHDRRAIHRTATESLDGEGIELNGYSVESFGHVVAHNSISNVADGISNGTYNIDIFGNDIFDTSDDGV